MGDWAELHLHLPGLHKEKRERFSEAKNVATVPFMSLVKKPQMNQGSDFSVCLVHLFSFPASVAVCPLSPGMATYGNASLTLLIS